MHLLYENFAKNSTINVLTENPDYVFNTALKDDRLSRVARTIAVDDQTFTFDLGSALAVKKFLLVDHNFTSSVTLTLEGNATNVWTAPSYTTSLTYGTYIYKDLGTQTYRYWRLTVDDPTNTDTYLEISKIYLGSYLDIDIDTGISIPHKSNSTSSKSISGQLYGNRILQYKAAEFTASNVNETDRQLIKTFWSYVDVVKPFWVLIWQDDLTVEPPLYCNLTDPPSMVKVAEYGNVWNLAFKIEQAL